MGTLPRISPKLANTISSLLTESKKLLAESSPIAQRFEAKCAELGIHRPPSLYEHPFWPGEGALSGHNAILLGPGFRMREPLVQDFSLSHELGHILRGDMGGSRRAVEQATDRLALQIEGSKVAGIAFVEQSEKAFKEELQLFRQPETTFKGRLLNRIMDAAKNAEQRHKYGTHAERLQNILATNVSDKTHVERLVAEHNQRSFIPFP